jgi:hypothetical protein
MKIKVQKKKKPLSCINGVKGAISLFMPLLMTPFLTIAVLLVEAGRYNSAVSLLDEALGVSSMSTLANYDDYLQEHFDKNYFRQVDKWIYSFAMIISDPYWEHALRCWDGLGGMLKVDPVQATPEWEEVIYDVEKELDEELKDEPRCMGFCHSYWSAKRAALARRGIEWRSPSAMNPRVMFD